MKACADESYTTPPLTMREPAVSVAVSMSRPTPSTSTISSFSWRCTKKVAELWPSVSKLRTHALAKRHSRAGTRDAASRRSCLPRTRAWMSVAERSCSSSSSRPCRRTSSSWLSRRRSSCRRASSSAGSTRPPSPSSHTRASFWSARCERSTDSKTVACRASASEICTAAAGSSVDHSSDGIPSTLSPSGAASSASCISLNWFWSRGGGGGAAGRRAASRPDADESVGPGARLTGLGDGDGPSLSLAPLVALVRLRPVLE